MPPDRLPRIVATLLTIALALLAFLFFLVALSSETERRCVKLGNQVLGGDCPKSSPSLQH
jgi:hypothetical protein